MKGYVQVPLWQGIFDTFVVIVSYELGGWVLSHLAWAP